MKWETAKLVEIVCERDDEEDDGKQNSFSGEVFDVIWFLFFRSACLLWREREKKDTDGISGHDFGELYEIQ